jgi:3-isopropylmalate/(R)-2-methylmalate dehydratase small subunit
MRDNIDTDVIIRIEKLVGTANRDKLGQWCLAALRYLPDGSENPEFVLNQAPFRSSQILLAGANFGCGSSREGAVRALMQMGLRAVLAPGFGDIFYGNCFQNGMLPVKLASASIDAIALELRNSPGAQVTVDLEQQLVRSPSGGEYAFEVPRLRRDALLEGVDDIGLTLKRKETIASFQSRDRLARPWIYDIAGVTV